MACLLTGTRVFCLLVLVVVQPIAYIVILGADLVGYCPSASTISANRAGAARELMALLNLPPGKVAGMAPDLLPDKEAEIVLCCWDAA
jgi:hypothetical protein